MDILHLMFPLESTHLAWKDDEDRKKALVFSSKETNLTLIYSEEKCPSIYLLFQLAVSECSRDGHAVLITQEQMKHLPKQIHGMPHPDAVALKNLKMMYVTTLSDLVNYLADIHQMPLLPDLILVENLHHYAQQQGEAGPHTLAKICSLLEDAAKFITQKRDQPCKIVASIVDNSGSFKNICKRYPANFLHLHGTSKSTFTLKNEPAKAASRDGSQHISIDYLEALDCVQIKDISFFEK